MKIFVLFLLVILVISGAKLQLNTKDQAIKFYSPAKGIYIVDIDVKKCPDCLYPYVSDSLETIETIAEKTNSPVVINTGFFDPTNAKTASYIIKDDQIAADPSLNQNLMNNPGIKEYLPDILNRSEFRILNCEEKQRAFEIVQHNESASSGCEIIHSIQAGPKLFPELKLSEEVFVVKKGDKIVKQSAGALEKYARSAIGIKNRHVLLIAVSNESPMTLPELAAFVEKLGVDSAMAFDGGSSTSLYINLPDNQKFILTSAKDNAARKVKSALLIKNLSQ
ncbi:MAG: phosphodiester glycosidase family protein [bacterium]